MNLIRISFPPESECAAPSAAIAADAAAAGDRIESKGKTAAPHFLLLISIVSMASWLAGRWFRRRHHHHHRFVVFQSKLGLAQAAQGGRVCRFKVEQGPTVRAARRARRCQANSAEWAMLRRTSAPRCSSRAPDTYEHWEHKAPPVPSQRANIASEVKPNQTKPGQASRWRRQRVDSTKLNSTQDEQPKMATKATEPVIKARPSRRR